MPADKLEAAQKQTLDALSSFDGKSNTQFEEHVCAAMKMAGDLATIDKAGID